MIYLKTFENFLLKYNLEDLKNQVSLYKLTDGIYCVFIKDDYVRAMTFLRFQEYYESHSDEFHEKNFKWDRYIQWYKQEHPKGKKDIFTYGYDWVGFNIPSESIKNCLKNIEDPNYYDNIMISIVNTIKDDNFYLIGVSELNDIDTLDHEIAHGFYYIDSDYKKEMDNLVNSMPSYIKKPVYKYIKNSGYNDSVKNDEFQAYMATGLDNKFKIFSQRKYTSKFIDVFKKFKNIHNIYPFEIKIQYIF